MHVARGLQGEPGAPAYALRDAPRAALAHQVRSGKESNQQGASSVLAGAFASSKLSGQARVRWLPDTQWQARFGSSRGRRLALAFAGAALVQIGAGIAGGCTMGLAISGGVALAPAAFLFMAGMFAGGIPTAWLWYRGRPG